MAARPRRPRVRVPDREGGPGAHRDAEDVRPAAVDARGTATGRRGAARQAAPVPDRRRRARAARAPDVGRPAALPAAGREGAEDAGVPAALPGRRRAGADGGRGEEARGRLAADAGGGGGGAGASRAGGARARRGAARRDPRRPTRGGCTRCSATSARSPGSAARGRTRSSAPRSSRRSRSPASSSPEEVERLAAAIDEELARGLELRERGAKDAQTYRIHNRLGEPCPECGTPLARVDFEEHTIYYCPRCQTGGRVLKDRRLSRLLK